MARIALPEEMMVAPYCYFSFTIKRTVVDKVYWDACGSARYGFDTNYAILHIDSRHTIFQEGAKITMVQAYQGYFVEDGRFISGDTLVKIPPRRRAIVTILEEEAIEEKNTRGSQERAFDEFFATMKSLNASGIEPIDDEFDDILADRVNITRELDL